MKWNGVPQIIDNLLLKYKMELDIITCVPISFRFIYLLILLSNSKLTDNE